VSEERLNELLSGWQEAQLRGRDLPAAELCRDCPELAAELSQRIHVLRQMNGLLRPPDPPTVSDAPKVPLRSIDEAARQRFEAAWRDGRAEPLERYLPPAEDPRYLATLEELVHIELEFAWRAAAAGPNGQPPTVEAYLAQFPPLRQGAIVRRLLQQEYQMRHRYGDAPPPDEYQARFPEYTPLELPTLVATPVSSPVSGPPPQPPGYDILGELGRGGFGVVYKARQLKLNRVVALKMILAGGHSSPDDLARFRTEAEAIARLQHPNIVQIHEVGEHEGRPFFSLEFCPGGSLDKELAGTPLRPCEAAALAERLARAVAAAHQKGIVHRDLKPANVLLGENGVPKITDFGLAKRLDVEKGQTRTGAIVGTPSYMAPEQAEGKRAVGPAADVYALGAILYEFLTGRPPFKAATPFDTLLQVVGDEPVPVRQLQPKVPRDLETICHKCLQKEPARRYGSAADLAEDLQRFRAGETISARPVGAGERAWRWGKRNPALTALAAVLTVGVIVSTWFAVSARHEAARADAKAEEAEQEAQAAGEAREAAKRGAQAGRQAVYNVNMLLTQIAWEQYQVPRVLQLLRDQPEDLRGFEWYYWRRQFERAHITLTGHTSGVQGVAFSPDGRHLAGACWDRTVKVWDALTGEGALTLVGHTRPVTSVAFSPDGRRLASASGDGTVKLWDAQTGRLALTLQGHTEGVSSVAFSPDGRRLASASYDRTVKVWDAQTGRLALTLQGHTEQVYGVAFSPDGRRLASASYDRTVKVWDAQTGRLALTLQGHTEQVNGVAFSPDGRRLASANGDSTVKVCDAQTGQETLTLKGHTGEVWGVAFSPDGRRLASASRDRTVKVWDAETGQAALTLVGYTQPVTSVAFSPDGRRLASAASDGRVKVWESHTGQAALTVVGHTQPVTSVAFSPGGRRLASASWDRTVKLWDALTGQETFTLKGRTGEVQSVAFSLDGRRLASATSDGRVKVWDVQTGEEALTLQGHTSAVNGVAFSPDGRRLASASSGDLDSKGRSIPGEVKVWDALTGQEERTLQGHTGAVTSVAFSPDGRRLASTSGDQTVKVWDALTFQLTHTLKGHTGAVDGVAFSPDGGRLATASYDGTVTVWDVLTGQEALTLKGHTRPVTSVAFSPDGRRLASASWDWTVKVWNAQTGQETLTLKGHTGEVWGVAFSPDGRRLASASRDRTVKVWDASSSQEASP
jgi:WD40 repeat protein/tRNA A-37 threonylcarbamoyl transferase component Bud32